MLETYFDQMHRYMQAVYANGYNPVMFGDWLASCATSTVCINALYEYYVTGIMVKIAELTSHPN